MGSFVRGITTCNSLKFIILVAVKYNFNCCTANFEIEININMANNQITLWTADNPPPMRYLKNNGSQGSLKKFNIKLKNILI